MKNELHVALIQTQIDWQNAEKNRERLRILLQKTQLNTDLVILPEMFTTGFTMDTEKVAENMKGHTITWLQKTAQEFQIAITGSIIIKENNTYYNRLIFVQPEGKLEYYDKKHLFTLAKEHENFSPGTKTLCVTYKGWKIKPLICYDLRFPVWSRNTENYDLLLYVANWPKPRMNAWDTLLQARAIENMSYVAGVNRIGIDHEGHQYTGHSAIYDMLGTGVTKTNEEDEQIIYATLDKSKLDTARNKFRFLNDSDSFSIGEPT